MSPTYFTPFISHLPLAHLVLMNPKFLNKKDADDEDLMRLKKLLKMISVSRSQWLKAEERKSLSQSTVTENPWASMAWYNETPVQWNPVQSTPGKRGHSLDLINLSPSVGSQKRVGGKKSRKVQFSHVFGRQCIVGLGVKTVNFTVWSVPEKIWLELSPTSAALTFTWALQSPRLATQIYTKDKEQVNLRSLPFETCKKDNLTQPW